MAQKLNEEIKNKIIDFLKDKKTGASSSEIAKGINRNRITVSKYLEIMNVMGLIECNNIAQAKIWTVSQNQMKDKILVVDDEPLIVNLVKLSIKQEKYQILECGTGDEALNMAKREKPRLIILDIMMPGMDGFEVCKKLKNNSETKDIKIIMLSAKGEQENKMKGIDQGADDYLTKPFDPSELDSMIESLINKECDSGINIITGLPNKKSLNEYLSKNKDIKKVLEIKLKNFDSYKNNFGKPSAEKTLRLISRLFKDKINDDMRSFIAHVEENKFVITTRLENIKQEIQNDFESILPYIYHNKQTDKKIELAFNDVKLK